MALHRGATGLFAVYDCVISWSYSLTFLMQNGKIALCEHFK